MIGLYWDVDLETSIVAVAVVGAEDLDSGEGEEEGLLSNDKEEGLLDISICDRIRCWARALYCALSALRLWRR